jgi:hypothetical protein
MSKRYFNKSGSRRVIQHKLTPKKNEEFSNEISLSDMNDHSKCPGNWKCRKPSDDFLDEIVEERTANNPDFPLLVEQAEKEHIHGVDCGHTDDQLDQEAEDAFI